MCEHTTWESVRVCMFECKLVCVRVNTRKNEREHAHVWVSVCLCVSVSSWSESVCALEGMCGHGTRGVQVGVSECASSGMRV